MNNQQSRNRLWILGSLLAIIVLAAGGWLLFLREDAYAFKGAELAGTPAPEINLTDQDGTGFSLESQRGKVVVVYFGYTYCPDFCPTTMLDMMKVNDALGDDAERFQVLMVSVDPQRDSPARLAEYLDFYDPGFIGVTDTTDGNALRDVLRGYGIMAAAQEPAEGSDGYLVDHSTSLYGIDPGGNLVLTWQYGTDPADIAADIEHLLK